MAFSILLVTFDEQSVAALLVAAFVLSWHIPRTLFAKKFSSCRGERMLRAGMYLCAAGCVFFLRFDNASVAKERSSAIISAAEGYKAANGEYPAKLDDMVPRFIPEIPRKAKNTLTDRGFTYRSRDGAHTLMYVAMPPFGRRVYNFETKKWSSPD